MGTTCWRCGVDWDLDPNLYKPDAPCPDCQEDVPDNYTWTSPHAKRIDVDKLKRLCAPGILSDLEVAEALGCSSQTVYRWRKKLKIPPTMTPAWEFIQDKDAAREQARRAWLDSDKPRKHDRTHGTAVQGQLTNINLNRTRQENFYERFVDGNQGFGDKPAGQVGGETTQAQRRLDERQGVA